MNALAFAADAAWREARAQHVDPDAEDVAAFSAGNERAFERLVVKYQTRIFNVVFRMMNHREEAEELTQEVFLTFFRQGASFRGDSLFSTWLFQIAINQCRNRSRYLQRRRVHSHDPLDLSTEVREDHARVIRSIPDSSHVPEDEVEGAQMRVLIAAQIAELPPDQREIIVLRDIEGLTYEEIAAILHIAEGTVKSRLHRARMDLRDRLRPLLESCQCGREMNDGQGGAKDATTAGRILRASNVNSRRTT